MRMKQFYPIVALFAFSSASYAQVGINTANPTSTLEVVAKNTTGAATNVDGLLVPRVDRQRAQSMTTIPTSTMIYVNNVTTGTQTGIAVNINAVGYYYYNGLAWVKLENPSGTVFSNLNIYNGDGTLQGNRIVTQGANTLSFLASAVNAFSVDGSTFSVDATNHRVGIGTAAPLSTFHVVSPTQSLGRYSLIDAPTGIAQNTILALRNTSALATGNYSLLGFTNNGPTVGGASWGIGSIRTGATSITGTEEDFTMGNSNGGNYLERIRITATGNIGMGTNTPSNKLHINATDPLRIQGTTAGDPNTDRPVVIDANGVIKSINTLSVLGIPNPAIFRLETAQSNFLNGVAAGGSQVVPMSVVKNTINGMSYNATTSTITFPPGTYQMTFVYEGSHNATGCTISSYLVDFPLNATTQRIHSTASHIEGGASNHGGTITYATIIPAARTWQIALGRGQSGNCSGPGMGLSALSTQLLVFRIGD